MSIIRLITGAAVFLFLLTFIGRELGLVAVIGGLIGVGIWGVYRIIKWTGSITINWRGE